MIVLTGMSQSALSLEPPPIGSDTNSNLVVVYPEVRQPFLKVYQTIAKGAAEGFAGATSEFMLREELPPSDLGTQLSDSLVVALGGRGVKQLQSLELAHPLVVGAVSREIPDVFGLTMIPDSSIIANRLKILAPMTTRVFVVVRDENAVVDLKFAQLEFNNVGVQLIIKEVKDVRGAAGSYREIVRSLGKGDAVWIPSGDRFVSNALLSILLQASWKSEFIVFSSNPTHVKRGAYFSVYPDNFKMGVRLGELAREIAQGSQQAAKMEPLKHVFVTVNERTSNHLGIQLTDEMKQHIDLVLPAR